MIIYSELQHHLQQILITGVEEGKLSLKILTPHLPVLLKELDPVRISEVLLNPHAVSLGQIQSTQPHYKLT